MDLDRISATARVERLASLRSTPHRQPGEQHANELFAPLLGELKDYDGGASDFNLGAFSFLLAYSDHVVAYVFTPVDKNNSRCEIYWLVRNDAEEGSDYDVDALTWLWDVTTIADQHIIAVSRPRYCAWSPTISTVPTDQLPTRADLCKTTRR